MTQVTDQTLILIVIFKVFVFLALGENFIWDLFSYFKSIMLFVA